MLNAKKSQKAKKSMTLKEYHERNYERKVKNEDINNTKKRV